MPYAKVGWACQPNTIKRKDRRNEKTKCKDYDGGGGSSLPAKLGIEDVSSPCHAELVSASVPRYERVSYVGQTLNQVQGDKNMQCVRKCLPSLRAAFTMAEILLSLTIIGVVAAITLPSLTGNINERTWNTQRKALYAACRRQLP